VNRRETPTATTEVLSGLDPAYLTAKEKLATGNTPAGPIPKRQYGRTEEELSIIGFGGMVVTNVTPKKASEYVAETVVGHEVHEAAAYDSDVEAKFPEG
jgi:hypothetical protein